MTNTTSERLKTRKFFTFGILVFMSSLSSMLSWVEHKKMFYNLGAWTYLFRANAVSSCSGFSHFLCVEKPLLKIICNCNYLLSLNIVADNDKGPQTVLMKDCPQKWPEKSFKENDNFSMKKIVGSTRDLSTEAVFSLDKYQLRNMGWKLCFCYSTYRK